MIIAELNFAAALTVAYRQEEDVRQLCRHCRHRRRRLPFIASVVVATRVRRST